MVEAFVSKNPYMAMWDQVVNQYAGEYGRHVEQYKAETGLEEVALVGRAGEGVWLAGELLAAAAIEKGKYSKVIFMMPGERRNTLSRSFLRVAEVPVNFSVSWIHSADDIVVFEEELLTFTSPILDVEVATMVRRMNPDGFCVVNSPKSPAEVAEIIDIPGTPVTVDATRISVDYLKNPFLMNTALIGAYLAVRKGIRIEDMEAAIKNFTNPRGHTVFAGKKGEMNIKALWAGYESAQR